ncbi:class I SAM-dependent methyltransferase [Actinoplanes sp. NPDC051513]|uniref:class I SAM-dependent methyltransferase n=1 Tax=Actinoplanes sp. NPDC051513 TaxID=3363908 RepID=UPI0037A4ECFC
MTQLDTNFAGIRNSAFVTLRARWLDSLDRRSILHDSWANSVAQQLNFDFTQLPQFDYTRFTIAARSRLLDEWVRRFLPDHPKAVVLDVGCGLDSRVLRVDPAPGHHWYDVDFPDMISLRDRVYPERSEHTSIGAAVADPGWLESISGDRPVIVVADTLFMFLPDDELRQFLRRVVDHFPHGEVVFTAYSGLVKQREIKKGLPPFFERNDIRIRWTYDGPDDIARLDDRLRLVERRSQTELRLHHGAPLYDKLMCTFVNISPQGRYAGTILRYQF